MFYALKLKNSQKGFTLIEIMVVVVIAAILMGAVTMSFPRTGDDLLKEDADRFSALVSLIQDEAILQSRDMALLIGESSYEFYSRSDATWGTYSDKPFVPRTLKGGFQSSLYVEGVPTNLKQQEKPKPQILVYSSGEMTPFTYVLSIPNESSVTIKVNAVGTIEQEFKKEDE